MSLKFAEKPQASIPLTAIDEPGFKAWFDGLSEPRKSWVKANRFKGGFGQAILLAGEGGEVEEAVAGLGGPKEQERNRFALAATQPRLPKEVFHLTSLPEGFDAETESLGWLLSNYRFERYAKQRAIGAQLVAPPGVDASRVEALAAGEALSRDLINTPASDMGPDALEEAARDLAKSFGANIDVIEGDALLDQNFPMIHAVGRAAARAPRLIDIRWGDAGPRLTLVGKGVCFDTGGLNLKPAASMGLMKKDMGGAATVLGLSQMIMALGVKVQLRVLIPAVENSVSGDAFRPGDILTSRKGLTVEINNTDAEGRLVLADALALASEETPDLIVSMATLTGAARVAVGPDLAPFYASDTDLADAIRKGAKVNADPVWEMPFHAPYEEMIEPGIADLDNAPKGGFGGSITAALFLRRFVDDGLRYAHFDIYGWQPKPAPARPKGGAGQGARAILNALPSVLGI